MSVTIPNLWPVETISIDVLSPIVILRSQAANLASATRGVLTAEIETTLKADGSVKHQFDVIAPAMGGYRHRILEVRHKGDMVYPVTIDSDSTSEIRVRTEQAFIDQLTNIFKSDYTLSIIHSLLARSNELADVDIEINTNDSHTVN